MTAYVYVMSCFLQGVEGSQAPEAQNAASDEHQACQKQMLSSSAHAAGQPCIKQLVFAFVGAVIDLKMGAQGRKEDVQVEAK